MLNEEKIKLMTRITIFEKHEESRGLRISKYYKEDYIRYGGLRTIIAATVCYWLIVALYCYFNMQEILSSINEMDYFKVIAKLMAGYLLSALVLYVMGFFVYLARYQKARRGLIIYNRNLKILPGIRLSGIKGLPVVTKIFSNGQLQVVESLNHHLGHFVGSIGIEVGVVRQVFGLVGEGVGRVVYQ